MTLLSAEVIALFIAHAINELVGEEDGCCPKCCAPCSALKELAEAGQLGDAVRPYVRRTGADWDWWKGDVETGHVDQETMFSRWRCTSNPPCGREDEMFMSWPKVEVIAEGPEVDAIVCDINADKRGEE